MISNPATKPSDKLNDFTLIVKQQNVKVKLRNGMIVEPYYYYAVDRTESDSFTTSEPFMMVWNLDGTSITRNDYDMMEIFYDKRK